MKAKHGIPEGSRTVTPWIISADTARLIDFVTSAFGGRETARMPDQDGRIVHAEAVVGDSVLLMFDAKPGWPPTPSFLRLYVEDCDAVYKRALDAGGTSITELTTLPFGDRVCRVRDPLGNLWWIHTRVEEVALEEMEKRAQQPEAAKAMKYVQESLATFFTGSSGRP